MVVNSSVNVDQILSILKMIEIEKYIIKYNLGNREDIITNENSDATSVW